MFVVHTVLVMLQAMTTAIFLKTCVDKSAAYEQFPCACFMRCFVAVGRPLVGCGLWCVVLPANATVCSLAFILVCVLHEVLGLGGSLGRLELLQYLLPKSFASGTTPWDEILTLADPLQLMCLHQDPAHYGAAVR